MNVFCSYHYTKKGYEGIGNAQVWTDKQFPLSITEIRRIEKDLAEKLKCKSIVLFNYQVLGE